VTSLESALHRITADLARSGVDFALIGGLAVSVRTEPRFTRDADFAVAVSGDAEAEALVQRLHAAGYEIAALVEQDAVGRLATVRLALAGDAEGPVMDLLFASSGIEHEVVAEADAIELLPGLTVKVACIAHLIALKVLSRDDERRPQDLVDLRALLRMATPDDVSRAHEALSVITARGYHRGRDLVPLLGSLLAPSEPS
jgi:predicted nucleotidyltransferase